MSAPRVAFETSWTRRIGIAALFAYVIYAISSLDVSWARILRGLDQGAVFLARLWPPNYAPDKIALITDGLIESLQIAVLSTAAGILL